MGGAALWGALAGSSLLLGALIATRLRPRTAIVGLVMGFGAGVLISAVAYELVDEAVEAAEGSGRVAVGLAAGALAFYLGDLYIDRRGGGQRKRSSGRQAGGSAQAIVLGTVLDGIPEGIVIGVSLIGGGGVSVAVISAVFLSNLPESIAATTGLERAGFTRRAIFWMWGGIALAVALSAMVGYGALDGASPETIAFVQGFAAGALLTMLADTMMPEAFEQGGRAVGLCTTLGFAVAFALTLIE
jgi:zinc transporter, ZIP family